MTCPRCQNPTTLTLDRECEWCGHLIPQNSNHEQAGLEVQLDALSELKNELKNAENSIRLNPPQQNSGPGKWIDSLFNGLTGEDSLTNPINHALASVVSRARLPEDRPSTLSLLDLATAQMAATKVSWWDSSEQTEGQEALYRAWKALKQRLENHLDRMSR